MGAKSFQDLRAWQTSRSFKLAVYRLSEETPIATHWRLRDQLRESAASAVSQIVEGFGRFNPADFARFLGMAKASLMEAQNHLLDAVDRGLISDESRAEHDKLAQRALRDIVSLLEYLQSREAQENAKNARAKRQAGRTANREPPNPEPRTSNPEPGT